jgi:ATP synthase protein I
MPDPSPHDRLPLQARRMLRQVSAKQDSLKRAEAQKNTFWESVAILGVVGWSVALPSLGGVALGVWLDRRWPGRFPWTVTLFAAGLAFGCLTAWTRIRGNHK